MAAAPAFDADLTIGAFQIGVLISYVLFGVTTTQTYIYYSRFPDDPRRIRWLVLFVWFCELVHAVCIGHTLYATTITGYGHPESLARTPASLATAILFSGIIGASVQGFFANRIYRFTNSLYIPCVCWTLSLLRLTFTTASFIFALQMDTLAKYEAQWGWLLSALLVLSSVVDLIIAATLVYHLYKQRSSAYRGTVAVMDKLIRWTIETGVVTSAGGIVTLITFLTLKNTFVWMGCFAALASLFSNSLLASLNARASLRPTMGGRPYSDGLPSFVQRMDTETKVTEVLTDTSGERYA
ncbi:hypothetical protein DFH09DRAFT_1135043 [Mycena vulgaris]|nr:hypothetical protein DFH09DRAFT_1135043 [Mycena vulgaris]